MERRGGEEEREGWREERKMDRLGTDDTSHSYGDKCK